MLKWFSIQRVLVLRQLPQSACIIAGFFCAYFFHFSVSDFWSAWQIIWATRFVFHSQTMKCLSLSLSPAMNPKRNTNMKSVFLSLHPMKKFHCSDAYGHKITIHQPAHKKNNTHIRWMFVNRDWQKRKQLTTSLGQCVYLPTRNKKIKQNTKSQKWIKGRISKA